MHIHVQAMLVGWLVYVSSTYPACTDRSFPFFSCPSRTAQRRSEPAQAAQPNLASETCPSSLAGMATGQVSQHAHPAKHRAPSSSSHCRWKRQMEQKLLPLPSIDPPFNHVHQSAPFSSDIVPNQRPFASYFHPTQPPEPQALTSIQSRGAPRGRRWMPPMFRTTPAMRGRTVRHNDQEEELD